MDGALKKGVGLVLVLFIIWFLFTDPNGLATLSKEVGTWIWEMLTQLFQAISRFLNTIFA